MLENINCNFQKSEKLTWYDKILKPTVLKLFPSSVYPNHITIFRFLATPIVLILMLTEYYTVGLFAFLIVASSDAIDGAMARTRGEITEWGKLYDPLADKILIGGMVFAIVWRYINFWLAMLIITIELVFIFGALYKKRKGKIIQANFCGKMKMCAQVLAVVFLLLAIVFQWNPLINVAANVFYVAIAFAILSILTHGI